MEIKLNRVYVSHYDNIEYPIFKLSDGSYLCIAFSYNHKQYYVNVYTEEDFVEQGFEESGYDDDTFDFLTKADIMV